ncbi:hypothetical protein [Moritella sp. F3]|uniref:hypothetical protein n=1 Tax=Moritella sp. F3 TaxID=2718882 RepID=UPI0018E16C90|nr:hypothetical protein [Moritella sp. F3]GIC77062.1 hypothetical protein FMO001_17890 [Moritella sp. F1]GIC82181.1 hypothetical protein FMO003_24620 [Moritella sp. F3]
MLYDINREVCGISVLLNKAGPEFTNAIIELCSSFEDLSKYHPQQSLTLEDEIESCCLLTIDKSPKNFMSSVLYTIHASSLLWAKVSSECGNEEWSPETEAFKTFAYRHDGGIIVEACQNLQHPFKRIVN